MRYFILMVMLCASSATIAQNLPERGEVRRGNKEFANESYDTAAEHYTRAMELSPDNFEARYNLGSALIKGEKLEEGEKLLAELAADSLLTDINRSEAYYNLGNSQFAQQKLEEALESYKSAMRFDPSDQEAKYNYAYTKALLQQQQENEDQNQDQNEDQQNQDQQDQQDQNQDQNQDQQNQDQQDQEQDQDQQDQEQNQDQQDQQDQDQQEQDQQDQPQPSAIPEQEREQMLDAIQAQEDKTQDDLKERARGVVIPAAKNW